MSLAQIHQCPHACQVLERARPWAAVGPVSAARQHQRAGAVQFAGVCIARRSAGFSLIEVMVAILILGIALAGLVHGITIALGSSKESEWQTTAVLFAQGKIEELRAEGGIKTGEDEGDCGSDLPLYRWKQTISATEIDGLHNVEVVVENSRTGRAICDLRTLLFEIPDATTKDKVPKSKISGRDAR